MVRVHGRVELLVIYQTVIIGASSATGGEGGGGESWLESLEDTAYIDEVAFLTSDFYMDVTFNDDGTKMYVANLSDSIDTYTLSTAYDVSTATDASETLDTSSESTSPISVRFNDDGTILYVADRSSVVYQYTLSTAWDVSSGSYASKSLDMTGQDARCEGIFVKGDGTALFASMYNSPGVYEYTLSTPWDLSSGSYASAFADSGVTVYYGLWFSPDGDYFYGTTGSNDNIQRWSMGTAWDVSTATKDSILGQPGVDLKDPVGSNLSSAFGLAFKPDGSQFVVLCNTDDVVYSFSCTA